MPNAPPTLPSPALAHACKAIPYDLCAKRQGIECVCVPWRAPGAYRPGAGCSQDPRVWRAEPSALLPFTPVEASDPLVQRAQW